MRKKFYGVSEDELSPNLLDQINQLESIHEIEECTFYPDVHFGYDFPIGTKAVTNKKIILPSAVGVDIYCGIRFELFDTPPFKLKSFLKTVDKRIKDATLPLKVLDFCQGKKFLSMKEVYLHLQPLIGQNVFTLGLEKCRLFSKPLSIEEIPFVDQLGTLGGGNHFLELVEAQNKFGILVHSGSRGFGYKVASEFIGKSKLPILRDPSKINSYNLKYVESCYFAILNRFILFEKTKEALPFLGAGIFNCDRPHNFYLPTLEGYVYYKGANYNQEGFENIVIGNFAQGSFSIIGKGESFSGLCHGAGRAKSRTQAKKDYNNNLSRLFTSKSIDLQMSKAARIEEDPSCYKDFDIIISNIEEEGLGEKNYKINTLGVIKH